jgi:hypothetical protein
MKQAHGHLGETNLPISETGRNFQQLLIHRFAFLRCHIVPELGKGRRISVCDVARLRRPAITEIQQLADRRHAQPVGFAAVYHPNQWARSGYPGN